MSFGVWPLSIQLRNAGTLFDGVPVSRRPKLPGAFCGEG
jgi:hypothetical protein